MYYLVHIISISLWPFYYGVFGLYLITALLAVYESSISIKRRYFKCSARSSKRPLPYTSIVVSAYLPNEANIIINTLEHILTIINRPKDGLELILAYNTPCDLPVEKDLIALSQRHPELRLLKVPNSKSKAENLNRAVEIARGTIIAIFDADHHPSPDCLERAWRWLRNGYHVVQGRNIIRNSDHNWLTRIITIEFEIMYAISHLGKSLISDSTIFAGSNGFWYTAILRQFKFDQDALTEDIDVTLKALLRGYRIVHDRSIISTELSPIDISSLWFQRKRWCQGWLQVSLRYQLLVLKSNVLTLTQKLYWTYLLLLREVCHLSGQLLIPMLIICWITEGILFLPFGVFFMATMFVATMGMLFQIYGAFFHRSQEVPYIWYLCFPLLHIFYSIMKSAILLAAFFDEIAGNKEWVVTGRSKKVEKSFARKLSH
ncbi:MAG: glycosyltransferase family 2 protein [Desulfobulbaceae bacterium]|nr:glycosyltransferase family 2 protein [Desulfobulbaceae bacterium]